MITHHQNLLYKHQKNKEKKIFEFNVLIYIKKKKKINFYIFVF